MKTPDLLLNIPADRVDELVREVIAGALGIEQVKAWRREFLLQVATISSEEGGIILGGITPRFFRGICERLGVPMANLSYKHPRYRIVDLAMKLDDASVAAKADLAAARKRMTETVRDLLRRLDALDQTDTAEAA